MAQKTTKIPRLPLTDDYIFKRVFAFEGNESVLKDLLEAILRKNIKNVTIKNPEIIPYERRKKSYKTPVVYNLLIILEPRY